MSVKMMSLIWEMDLPPTDKLVLLAVADWARDDGTYCWPSISTIAKKSGVSERTVQRTIRAAEKAKHLTRVEEKGKGCRYLLHPRHSVTPDRASPPTNDAKTPDRVSPNTLGTIISNGEMRAKAVLKLPEWSAFKAMRRQIRKPLNPTAEKKIIAKLLKLEDEHGFPPGAVLEQSTANCWQGVFPIQDDDNGRRNQRNGMGRHQSPDGLSSTARAAIDVFGSPSTGYQ